MEWKTHPTVPEAVEQSIVSLELGTVSVALVPVRLPAFRVTTASGCKMGNCCNLDLGEANYGAELEMWPVFSSPGRHVSKRSPGGQLEKDREPRRDCPHLLYGYVGWMLHFSVFSWHVACLVSSL